MQILNIQTRPGPLRPGRGLGSQGQDTFFFRQVDFLQTGRLSSDRKTFFRQVDFCSDMYTFFRQVDFLQTGQIPFTGHILFN